ncbi:acetyl-CoA synthetase alpha and beta chains [Vibrio ishigakensis]|uniref:Acetyl-CoA synthetase alpha and beta chains n=1 Tax=Vibrio ishigakensis TaxID=1481914 RepID=A0A0B8QBI2_9VIBR|nr:acetyl-CoA synthetase alpha and beta chains [Vibrio ishigakensis]
MGGDFTGTILPVNPKHASVAGILCYPDIQSLPVNTELAIICIEDFISEDLFQDLQNAGVKVAVVIANSVYNKQESKAAGTF